mmetsp:Transcript_10005/g.12697  ORF Transcript_10005/g.12697 Transcript_10005/m.12697 type:complete len:136 (-) Transcript_10005:1481-1888(-)
MHVRSKAHKVMINKCGYDQAVIKSSCSIFGFVFRKEVYSCFSLDDIISASSKVSVGEEILLALSPYKINKYIFSNSHKKANQAKQNERQLTITKITGNKSGRLCGGVINTSSMCIIIISEADMGIMTEDTNFCPF